MYSRHIWRADVRGGMEDRPQAGANGLASPSSLCPCGTQSGGRLPYERPGTFELRQADSAEKVLRYRATFAF